MSEPQAKEDTKDLRREERDPLGFLIIPVFCLILVAVIILWFNQKKDEEDQQFFPVVGRVTMNKQPLDGYFQINFYPMEESSNPVASAILDEDGSFELTSGSMGQVGAMPGEYRVVVVMLEESEESFRLIDPDSGKIKINPKDGGTIVPPDPDPPFDKDYSGRETTPQRAVVGKTNNQIDFDLPPPNAAQRAKAKAKAAKEAKNAKKLDPSLNQPLDRD